MGRMESVLEHPAWLDEVLSRWQEVVDDRNLEDLPYKIETNRSGQLIKSPAKVIHAGYQGEIAALLKAKLGGRVLTECGVATPEGVKVPDVAWCTQKQFDSAVDAYAFTPEICVEIKSPSNARAEFQAKVRLYLDAGAKEVWLVDKDGRVTFYNQSGVIEKSSYGVEIPPLK